MRVHSHQYRKVERGAIVDGAILMHEEMSALLRQRGTLVEHDVTRGMECMRAVKDGDLIYAGIGPYAQLYHLWREAAGVDCRIVREVHTSFWSGYWSQEELCAPFLRPGDLALYPTEYARQVFTANAQDSAVVYPMLDRLPRLAPRPIPRSGVRLGYLGALSKAKNFDQVLGVFARVRAADPRATLSFAGKPNNADFEAEGLAAWLGAHQLPSHAVQHRGIVSRAGLAAFFADIDLLLFPSTASRETLGRVVLEALAHGVPVLAADVGPAVELLPARNLVPTQLYTGVDLTMARCVPLGAIDEQAAARKILAGDYELASLVNPAPYRDACWWDCIEGGHRPERAAPHHDRRIVQALQVAPRSAPVTKGDAQTVAELFLAYFAGQPGTIGRLIDAAGLPPAHRARLHQVVEAPRNLADYRAFPALVDALVLSPLSYRLRESTQAEQHDAQEPLT